MSEAAEIMLTHDFSQLPVVDPDDKVVGAITNDSIIRALSSFRCRIGELRVRDAMRKPALFTPKDDVFDLLKVLEDDFSAIIVDAEHHLVGIVTAFDTTEYFRERSEDLMVIEDIETAIKDHIVFCHLDPNGGIDRIRLLETIKGALPGLKERNRGRFVHALRHYLKSTGQTLGPLDEKAVEESLNKLFGDDDEKKFEELSLYEYQQLLLANDVWDRSFADSGMDRNVIRGLLDEVREMRNRLFHFRGQLTDFERQRLKLCSDWFVNHPHLDAIREPELTDVELSTSEGRGRENWPAQRSTQDAPHILFDGSGDYYGESDSRYAPLGEWLRAYSEAERKVKLGFRQIEDIIDNKLPKSAYSHRAWWANDSKSHVQSRQWLSAGWRVGSVLFSSKQVTFVKMSQREQEHIEFFNGLRIELRRLTDIAVDNSSPTGANYFVVCRYLQQGKLAAVLAICFLRKNRFRVEVIIDSGHKDENKSRFEELHRLKDSIEGKFGEKLSWELLEKRRPSRIAKYHPGNVSIDTIDKPKLVKWSVDVVQRLHGAVVEPISKMITPSD